MECSEYIIPFVELDENDIKTKDNILALFESKKHLESYEYEDLIQKIYRLLFLKLIKYNKCIPLLNKILDYIISNINSDNTKRIFAEILKVELLVGNFYYFLKDKLEDNKKFEKYSMVFQTVCMPIYEDKSTIKEHILAVLKQFMSKNVIDEDITDLGLCFLIMSNQYDLFTEYNDVFSSKYYLLLLYLVEIEDLNGLKTFLMHNNGHKITLEKFYITNINEHAILQYFFQNCNKEDRHAFIRSFKSHKLIDQYLFELCDSENVYEVLVDTYNPSDFYSTQMIFYKLFKIDNIKAEIYLKKFIIETKTTTLANIFFENCFNIDHDFIECCLINKNNIQKIKDQNLVAITNSNYFYLLTKESLIYTKCIEKLANIKDLNININFVTKVLFSDHIKICEKMLKKVLFFVQHFPKSKNRLFTCIKPIFDSLAKKCDKQLVVDDSDQTNTNDLVTISPSINPKLIKTFYEIINVFRSEAEMLDYLNLCILLDFEIFITNCLFLNQKNLDIFFVSAVHEIFYQHQNQSKFDFFLKKFYKYMNAAIFKDYYWNLIIKKEMKISMIYKNLEILKKISDILEKEKNETLNAELDKITNNYNDTVLLKIFFIQNILDDAYIIKLLMEELKRYQLDYLLLDVIIAQCNKNNMYHEGLVFEASSIILEDKFTNFCLYGNFYQYESAGKQTLIKLTGTNIELDICLYNSKLLLISTEFGVSDKIFLSEEQQSIKKLNLGIKFQKNCVKIYIHNNKYEKSLITCTNICIGQNFKGVIAKILWYEGNNFDVKYFEELNRSDYYIKYIQPLEKKLIFRHEKGLFIDSLKPYFMYKETSVNIKNIIINENLHWLTKKQIKNLILETSQKDEKLRSIIENHISTAIINLKGQN